MASKRALLERRRYMLGAVTAFTAILILSSFAGLNASADSRDSTSRATPATSPQAGPEGLTFSKEESNFYPASATRRRASLTSVPLSFEPNQGQTDSRVEFLCRGSGYTLYLTPGEVVVNLERQPSPATGNRFGAAPVDTLRVKLIGANGNVNAAGVDPQPGVVSYFIGNDPKKWHAGIPTYGKVRYAQVYPGVDLVFYGNQRQLEYDFVVAPGADPGAIAWQIGGARASIDAEGNLVLNADNGPARFKKPVLYQMDGDQKVSIEGSFIVTGDQVRFSTGNYDHAKALVIDPVLSYASYLAGSGADYIGQAMGPGNLQVGASQGLAVDSAGSIYVTGSTYSLDFPTKSGYQSTPPAKQGSWPAVFVTKFSPDGTSLIYSTYLGGNGSEFAYAIAVDSSGDAYVTGQTNSVNFPITTGAYQTVCSPTPTNQGPPYAAACNSANASAFVTKLNATGNALVYSTFFGGYGWAYGTAIAVDGAGRAYIAGVNQNITCHSSYAFQGCFPTTSGSVIPASALVGGGSAQYAFAAVFDPTGAQLLYSTLFGGQNTTCGCGPTLATGMVVDANGYFYLVGETQAGTLPTTSGVVQRTAGPLDPTGTFVSLAFRGFIAKFNPVTSAGGVSLAYATYLGGHTGNTSDYISGITIDSASNAYIVGYTNSSDFPVTNGAYQTVCGLGGTCAAAHVTKLNPSASAILWSTFVGDAKQDGSDAVFYTGPIQLDGSGNVYITGQIGFGFPMVNPVEPAPTSGSMQVLVAELDVTGSQLLFSSTIGSNGLHTAEPAGLAVDAYGSIYLAGNHIGPGLITTPGAFQTTANPSLCCYHGFVAKIAAHGGVPHVVTLPVGEIKTATVTISGMVEPNGAATAYWFEYGPREGKLTAAPSQTLPPGTAEAKVNVQLAGLVPLTEYYYRVVAQNSAGISRGQILKFRYDGQKVRASSPLTSSANSANSANSAVSQTAASDGASASSVLATNRNTNARTGNTVTTQTANLEVAPGRTTPLVVSLSGVVEGTPVAATCADLPEGATCRYDANSQTVTITPAANTPSGSYPIRVTFTTERGVD